MDMFKFEHYTIRRQFLSLFGCKFWVYDPEGQVVLFSKQKAFKLKEDIRVYTDESMREERLMIKARKVLDFSSAYDVVDSVEQKKLGALRRKGLKSILKDSWEILDENDNTIGIIEEDSMALALVRRFLTNLIPQTFHVKKDENSPELVTYKQNFNPFLLKLNVILSPESKALIDPRIALAAGILLVAIEGRQN